MGERGVLVDHATVHRWSIKILPVLAAAFRRCKRPVGASWRMDETYIKVAGQWKYLYRAVDRDGDTIDFLLCARRDHAAARCFFEQAVRPMLGFKSFRCARALIAGIETMHMIKKGQMECLEGQASSAAIN